ncbi:TPA: hypothetical protein QH405_001415 [Klebsiella michiganensis]|nr:hypothetical protein [Klebsiella michiganensis]
MSNSFDFELVADDRVSGTIDEINEAIKNLLPHLDEAQEKLNLGGDETVDSLDDVGGRLDKMSRSALTVRSVAMDAIAYKVTLIAIAKATFGWPFLMA